MRNTKYMPNRTNPSPHLHHPKGFTFLLRKKAKLLLKSSNSGFTLIELMVAISIIAIMSVAGIIIYTDVQKKSRDSKRKQDLKAIKTALEFYYKDNGKYPSARGCPYGSNCYAYSTSGENWIPELVSGKYMDRVPQDPINNNIGPFYPGNYSYAYGNVGTNGQGYDLTTQLENSNDGETCAKKNWKWAQYDGDSTPNPWCPAHGGNSSHSNNIYEASPDR